MAREIAYCDVCGARVFRDDTRSGAVLLDRTYCLNCLGPAAPHATDPSAPPRRRESTRYRRAGAAPARRAAPAPSPRGRGLRVGLVALGLLAGGLVLWGASGSEPAPGVKAVTAAPPPRPTPPRRSTVAPLPLPALIPTAPVEPSPVKADPPPEPEPDPARQARAKELHDEIAEACQVLGDEGRFDDAIQLIETFPADLRHLGAWKSLEGVKRQIEQLRSSGLPRKVPR